MFCSRRFCFALATFVAACVIVSGRNASGGGFQSVDGVDSSGGIPSVCSFGVNLSWKSGYDYITIYGAGEMYDFPSASYFPWGRTNNPIARVEINEGVTSIGSHAFSSRPSLTYVKIPASVKSIGYAAFADCPLLTQIDIDDGNTNFRFIDGVLFNSDRSQLIQCTAAKTGTYTIPDTVTTIVDSAFHSCHSLTNIVVPPSVQYIGNNSFYSCDNLMNISIPKSVRTIGNNAFQSCHSLRNVTINDGVNSIGSYAFDDCCSLETITIPQSVSSIGFRAFSSCVNLTSIEVDGSNTAFSSVHGVLFDSACTKLIQYPIGKKESSYTIPKSVRTIEDGAFADCSSLSYLDVEEENGFFKSDEGVLYDNELHTLVVYPAGITNASYTIPDEVNTIGAYAFRSCSNIVNVSAGVLTTIGDYAFYSCKSLSSLTIRKDPQSPSMLTIGDYAFFSCNNLNMTIPDNVVKIGNYAFYDCQTLTSVNIPNTVSFLGNYSFSHCQNVIDLVIGDSVEVIGEEAFSQSKITSIVIPKSVRAIGRSAFEKCDELKDVDGGDNVELIEDYAFLRCPKLGITSIPDGVKTIGLYAFHQSGISGDLKIGKNVISIKDAAFSRCSELKSVTFSDSVVSIGPYAFWANDLLTNVTFGKNVEAIGFGAFYQCPSLKGVTLRSSVRSIESMAFAYCGNITHFAIPSSVSSIGEGIWAGCSSLVSIDVDKENKYFSVVDGVLFNYDRSTIIKYPDGINNLSYTIPNTVTTVAPFCFLSSKISSINISNSVTTLEKYAFGQCNHLRNVTIPDGVTTIKAYAFYSCEELTSVTISESVSSMGGNAFINCDRLSRIFYLGSTLFDPSVLPSGAHLESVCVPSDYNSTTFCGVEVTSDTLCQTFQSSLNHCFKAELNDDGEFIQRMWKNATEYEEQSNDCVEYKCVNSSGPTWSVKCSSSDGISRTCVNNQCLEKETFMEGTVSIVIEIEDDLDVNEVNISLLLDALSEEGVSLDLTKVGYESDSKGNIVQIILIVDDEETVNAVLVAIESIKTKEECSNGKRSGVCRMIHNASINVENLSGACKCFEYAEFILFFMMTLIFMFQ